MVMQIKLVVVVVVECLANDVLSGLVLFYSHFLLLCNLSVLWLSVVTFNDESLRQRQLARILYNTSPTPDKRVTRPGRAGNPPRQVNPRIM